MSYHYKTKQMLKEAGRELGPRLGKLAVSKGLPVAQVAFITGASRPTVYQWFAGGAVSNAYRSAVQALINKLRTGTREQIADMKKTKAYIAPLF